MRYSQMEKMVKDLSAGGVGGAAGGGGGRVVPDLSEMINPYAPSFESRSDFDGEWFNGDGTFVDTRELSYGLTGDEPLSPASNGYFVTVNISVPTDEDVVRVLMYNFDGTGQNLTLEEVCGPTPAVASGGNILKTYYMPADYDVAFEIVGGGKFGPPTLTREKAVIDPSGNGTGVDLVHGFIHFPVTVDVPAGYEYQLNGPDLFPQVMECQLVDGVCDYFNGQIRSINPGDWNALVNPAAPARVMFTSPLHWPDIGYAIVRDGSLNTFGVLEWGFQVS